MKAKLAVGYERDPTLSPSSVPDLSELPGDQGSPDFRLPQSPWKSELSLLLYLQGPNVLPAAGGKRIQKKQGPFLKVVLAIGHRVTGSRL